MSTFKKEISILNIQKGIVIGILLLMVARCAIVSSNSGPTSPTVGKITERPYYAVNGFVNDLIAAENPCTIVEGPYQMPGGLIIYVVEKKNGGRVTAVVGSAEFQVGQRVKLTYYEMSSQGVGNINLPTLKKQKQNTD